MDGEFFNISLFLCHIYPKPHPLLDRNIIAYWPACIVRENRVLCFYLYRIRNYVYHGHNKMLRSQSYFKWFSLILFYYILYYVIMQCKKNNELNRNQTVKDNSWRFFFLYHNIISGAKYHGKIIGVAQIIWGDLPHIILLYRPIKCPSFLLSIHNIHPLIFEVLPQ